MKKRLWMDGCRAASMMLAGMVAVVAPAMAQRTTVQTVQTTQQVQQAQQAQQAQQTANTSSRFVEACNSAENNGQPTPGCHNVPQLRGNELEQLRQEALRTRNPQLMTMVGDAYQNRRTGSGDISQAYRWYVLSAVRGDPQAMARLSEMYRRGQGTAPDRVKAMGYAKLAQQTAPDSAAGKQAAQTVQTLSKSMAGKELAQADRFAAELAQQMGAMPGGMVAGAQNTPLSQTGPKQVFGGQHLPGEANAVVSSLPQTPAVAQDGMRQAAAWPAIAGQAMPAALLPGQMAGQQASVAQQQALVVEKPVNAQAQKQQRPQPQSPSQPRQQHLQPERLPAAPAPSQPIELRAPAAAASAAVAPAQPPVSPASAAAPQGAAR